MDMQTRPLNLMTHNEVDQMGAELDALRSEVVADLGQRDADYIRGIVRRQKLSEIAGRSLIHFSLTPISWAAGVGLLSISKILDNMEIGHNVIHGQYDWMNDPELNSRTFEWDIVCDAESWRRYHNFEHHTFTNIIGKDRDYGYGLLRLSNDIPWHRRNLTQLVNYVGLSVFFQWGVALHELEIDNIRSGAVQPREKLPFLKRFLKKSGAQLGKDYALFPALAGPFAPKVALANFFANLNRNLWTSTIIFCGHFTEDAQTFSEEECENETRGQWYHRQMLGSSNFTGPRLLHIMSGHLSYQIEHHLFPDIPAHRYPEMATKVEEICKRYGVPYNTGTFAQQYRGVLGRITRYSFPEDVVHTAKAASQSSSAAVQKISRFIGTAASRLTGLGLR
jgi:fatty acid desaturase